VKLTGLEGPRDLEILHHLATIGELDDHTSRRKFGKIARLGVEGLIRMGHPIRIQPSMARGHWNRYVWIPLE
jgi:hypothetical protein